MPSYDYDVIVVGAGLAGLSAAAILASSGARVLVLEQGEVPGGCCRTLEIEGYRFDIGPSAFYGLLPGEPLRELFEAIREDGKLKDRSFMAPLLPGPQVLLPGHRITLFPELPRLLEELGREYPQYMRLVRKLYSLAIKEASLRRKPYPYSRAPLAHGLRLRGLFRRLLGHAEGRECMEALSRFFSPGSQGLDTATVHNTFRNLCSPFYLFADGSSSLPQFLVQTILSKGGEINCGAKVESLLQDNGRVVGVVATLQSTPGQITARAVVLNAPAPGVCGELLNPRELRGCTGRELHRVFPFSLLVGVKEDALPEQLSPLAIVQPSKPYPQVTGGVVRLSLNPQWKDGWAPKKERALKATVFLSHAEEEGYDKNSIERLKQFLLQSLTEVIPFLRMHITFLKTLTPEDYRRLCGRKGGSLCPGYRGSRPYKGKKAWGSPFAGLHLVGADNIGEFGTLAAVDSGLSAGKALSS